MRLFFGLIMLLVFHWRCANTPVSSPDLIPNSIDTSKIVIDLESLDFSPYGQGDTVFVKFDHSRKRATQYLGYAFQPILSDWIEKFDLDTSTAQLVWVCGDDYRPTNLVSEALSQDGGYLAFRDLEVEESLIWPEALVEKYAPFYLVWDSIPYGDHSVAWPYGLKKIELLRSDPYATLYPPEQGSLMKGFTRFRKHCQKCHPLNGIGGDLGPEFNRPRNITTYFSRQDIIEYAKNPKSFRENSKMYAIKSISDSDYDAIVDYLEWLGKLE